MGTGVGNQRIARNLGRLKGWRGAWLVLPVGLVLAVVALYAAGDLYFSTERAIQVNWGISVPTGLREVEHQEEQSFHGDGYRFTVFDVENSTKLEGTFFDVSQMSDSQLTSDQIELVSAVTGEFRPENNLAVPQPGLWRTEKSVDDNRLLCLFDSASNRFYIYEDIS